MNSSWLVEIASIWAFHASTRVEEDCSFPTEAVHEYWLKNRVRMDGWNAMITAHSRRLNSPSIAQRSRGWHKLKRVVEEVLLAEPLARVCVSIAARLESRQIDHDSRAILHNVYIAHQEVRNRCLRLIADGLERGNCEAEELNALRSYLEHWTDMLLGYFVNSEEAEEYAHSPRRVAEFASDYCERSLGDQSQVIWSLLIASCRAWLNKHVAHDPISPRINQQISETAMGMLHPDLFDSMGLLRTHLIKRIERGLEQAGETLKRLDDGTWETMSNVVRSSASQKSSVRF
jgi:hypothetical protein